MAGADASIYSLIRQPQQQGPLEQYGQMMQLKSLMGQQGVQDLQRREIEENLGEKGRVRDFWKTYTGKVEDATDPLLRVSPAAGMAHAKTLAERKKSEADLLKSQTETLKQSLQIHRDQLASIDTPEGAAKWVLAGFNDASLSPIMQKTGSPQEVISRIPTDPAGFQQWKMKNGLGIEKLLEMTKPDYKTVGGGGQTVVRQMNPNAPGFSADPIQHTMTPEGKDARDRGWAGLNQPVWDSERGVLVQRPPVGPRMGGSVMAGAPAAAPASPTVAAPGAAPVANSAPSAPAVITPPGLPPKPDQYGEPKEVTGTDGKPRLVMQNKRTGELVDANTRQPVAGVGPKMGESAQKQQTGVQTTKAAITEYRDALKNWSATDIANPNARAKMGTVYNNMMLQAKEAYNLGVLNGPDYMILQEVITSPATLRGGITSKEALDAQAVKLDEIMSKIGSTVTSVQSGVNTPDATKPPAPQYSRAEIEAELRRRKVIK